MHQMQTRHACHPDAIFQPIFFVFYARLVLVIVPVHPNSAPD